jgi:hypothetical protein
VKYSFYEEFECVFDIFSKYHVKMLSGDFNANVGRKGIVKPTIENESFHKISNGIEVRVVNFAHPKTEGMHDRENELACNWQYEQKYFGPL